MKKDSWRKGCSFYNRQEEWQNKTVENRVKNTKNSNKTAKTYNFQVGDKVLIDNQLFVSKNKKFSPMWIGPFVITKVLNKQNVEMKIKSRAQIYNVCRLKKFMNPES